MNENDQKKMASEIVLRAREECRKKKINPYVNYKIKETGLKKGEKLSEQLYDNRKKIFKINNNIYRLNDNTYKSIDFENVMLKLTRLNQKNHTNKSLSLIKNILKKEIKF